MHQPSISSAWVAASLSASLARPFSVVLRQYASRSRVRDENRGGAKGGKRSGRGAGARSGVSVAAPEDKASGQEQEE
jgi:hypothetical protein